MAEIDGLRIHYLIAGHGPTVMLFHGYAETSLMWRPLMPLLANNFTVIAPDLPGIGDSGIPSDGLDMKTAAVRMHALATSLGVEKARVVGHDIGLMVAYAYAAQFPQEVEKLVVMDAFLPGVDAMGSRLQQSGAVAFSVPRTDTRTVSPRPGTDLFRLLLERFRRRPDPIDS